MVHLAGFAITVANPKTLVLYLALLPAFVDVAAVDAGGLLALGVASVVVLPGVLGAYAAASARARNLLASARARRRLDRAAGAVMLALPEPSSPVEISYSSHLRLKVYT